MSIIQCAKFVVMKTASLEAGRMQPPGRPMVGFAAIDPMSGAAMNEPYTIAPIQKLP